MNEQDTHDYCLLWAEARDIAMERGLKMSLTCPMENVCEGERCAFIDPIKKIKGIIYKVEQEPIIGC
jgi:hypothetical protein